MGRILIVDDDAQARNLMREALEPLKHEMIVARDGAEALEAIDARLPDLLILDMKLPRASGHQVLEKLRYRKIRLPTIIVSAYEAFKSDFEVWASQNVRCYFDKPFDLEQLTTAVQEVLEGKRRSP